jgi:hypothetical protein
MRMREEDEEKRRYFSRLSYVVNKERIAVAFLSKFILFFCRARSLSPPIPSNEKDEIGYSK